MTNSDDETHGGTSPNEAGDDFTETLSEELSQTHLPERIGKYRIKRRIASGGMGTVYEAQQEQPRRSIAVKVMRAGRYTDSALRRFSYEAQILARIRHPGVAQIYEAGSYDEDGHEIPYFAMEYIPNAKLITEYCKEQRRGTREILELFVQVCDAVHHGHQRGIVHRDLKPANILVDSSGHPKIIDFGVARAADSDMAEAPEQTQAGQIVGTLQYMSPEQFEMDSADIDTRSDIYALGVILYELLTKQLPYDVRGSRLHEVSTIVRESTPPELGSIKPSLSGDLATIVGCALEKDRDRRYQSAHGLRSDIERYLSGAAITAQPATLGYQIRVLVRRNKVLIAAAGIAIVALIGGTVFSTVMYFKASAERARAELNAERSEKAFDFVGEMMRQARPQGWGDQPTVADLLQNTLGQAGTTFADDPLVAAEIHSTLAWAYLPHEDFEMFENHCQTALDLRLSTLEPHDPLILESMRDLARAQSIRGNTEALIQTHERLVELSRATGDPIDILTERADLAGAYESAGRYDDALEILDELIEASIIEFGEGDTATAELMAQAAYVQLKQNELGQACEKADLAWEMIGARPIEGDSSVNFVRSALAACRIVQGDLAAAAALYDQTAPRDAGIVMAFQGEPELPTNGAAMLVMWETWCPFSQRVVPVIEDLHRRFSEDGLGVAGLTRVTRGSSDERVKLFLRDRKLSFPVLKDNGKSFSYFAATGTPYVVLLSGGRVVWKGSVVTRADLADQLVPALVAAAATGSASES